MYIQITNRCNMKCRHCCYNCTSTGEDMQRSVFATACKLANELNVFIDIGGGEPTLHPLLWDFIGIALRYRRTNVLCIVTNGKLREDALALLHLASHRTLYACLSQDKFHEPIDYEVIKAFEDSQYDSKYIAIRDITHGGILEPAPFGRAKEWVSGKDMRCSGNDLHIAPDGMIYACGCKTVKYGTVFEPQLPDPLPDEWCPDKLG